MDAVRRGLDLVGRLVRDHPLLELPDAVDPILDVERHHLGVEPAHRLDERVVARADDERGDPRIEARGDEIVAAPRVEIEEALELRGASEQRDLGARLPARLADESVEDVGARRGDDPRGVVAIEQPARRALRIGRGARGERGRARARARPNSCARSSGASSVVGGAARY